MPNYEPLRDELSKILENQRISKKKQDQILETTQRGFIRLTLRNEDLLKSNEQVIREVSNQFPGKPNITSHSFRIGYITQLWKDSKNIEFVKQIIRHQKLDTTSAYVNKLSDQERQKRINDLSI